MLGADVIVAPVLQPGKTAAMVYLPAGRWAYLWDGGTRGSTVAGINVTLPVSARPPPIPPAPSLCPEATAHPAWHNCCIRRPWACRPCSIGRGQASVRPCGRAWPRSRHGPVLGPDCDVWMCSDANNTEATASSGTVAHTPFLVAQALSVYSEVGVRDLIMSESPGSVIASEPTRKYLPQAVPSVMLSPL